MLNFLSFLVLFNTVKTDKKINIKPYEEKLYYLTYQDKT